MGVNWGDWENGKRMREEEQITKHKKTKGERSSGDVSQGVCVMASCLCSVWRL